MKIRDIFQRGTAVAVCAVALLWFVSGCSSVPTPSGTQPVASALPGNPSEAATAAGHGEFTVGVSMLDAWNAVGQILIRLDGVAYEGRAQMLGMYAVSYRGERFLILTRALVMDASNRGMLTKVSAVMPDGKPNASVAALELLNLLHERMPDELALIAAGGRGRVQP